MHFRGQKKFENLGPNNKYNEQGNSFFCSPQTSQPSHSMSGDLWPVVMKSSPPSTHRPGWTPQGLLFESKNHPTHPMLHPRQLGAKGGHCQASGSSR